jgi:hypothetical protein
MSDKYARKYMKIRYDIQNKLILLLAKVCSQKLP